MIQDKDKKIYYNKYMFYSSDKISIYFPHILKEKNDITSILLSNKKLNSSDFQYTKFNFRRIYNDIYLLILNKRIEEYNNFIKKDGIIVDNKYNEKIFGFHTDKNCTSYSYLYTIMDEEIIVDKLKEIDLVLLTYNLVGRPIRTISKNITNYSFVDDIFNYNMDYLQKLTFEKLIIDIIIDKLNKNYEVFPRIVFYEYFMTINNDTVILENKEEESGYSKFDYVMYSKCGYNYKKENPLIVQTCHRYNNNREIKRDLDFEIKEDTLYFFELKSSYDLENKNNIFDELFKNYSIFIDLYKSKNWINENTKKEIMLIYGNEKDNNLIDKYEELIWHFLENNKECVFNVVYSMKSYPFFSHYLAIKKYDGIKKENKRLSNENKIIKNENEKLLNENKDLKNQIDNLQLKVEVLQKIISAK